MVDDTILDWMRERVADNGFTNAGDIAKQFLEERSIDNSLCSEFNDTIDTAFYLAGEIHGFKGHLTRSK